MICLLKACFLHKKLLAAKTVNAELKNRLDYIKVSDKGGEKLIGVEKVTEVLTKVLVPVRSKLDQLPDSICNSLNPNDPQLARKVLSKAFESIFADVRKNLSHPIDFLGGSSIISQVPDLEDF